MKERDTIYPFDTKKAAAALPEFLRRFDSNLDCIYRRHSNAINHFLSFVQTHCEARHGQSNPKLG